jgi:hypothetical protein
LLLRFKITWKKGYLKITRFLSNVKREEISANFHFGYEILSFGPRKAIYKRIFIFWTLMQNKFLKSCFSVPQIFVKENINLFENSTKHHGISLKFSLSGSLKLVQHIRWDYEKGTLIKDREKKEKWPKALGENEKRKHNSCVASTCAALFWAIGEVKGRRNDTPKKAIGQISLRVSKLWFHNHSNFICSN